MFTADQRVAIVFDRDSAPSPAQFREEIDDGRALGQRDRRAVGGDGDQGFGAAAALAAAFFWALYARTLPRLAASTMSATDRKLPVCP